MYRPNTLKKRLLQGGRALGCWVTLGSPQVAELLALTGFDFLLIDQEHGTGDPTDLIGMLQAMSATPCVGVVRVPANDPVYLKRVLDAGAEAVMIPGIDTAADAQAAVAACRYPPAGRRGSATGSIRASNYGLLGADYAETAAENLLIICQIESKSAVDNIDSIAAVEGVDLLFLGPNDLSGSIGRLGDFKHPEVAALLGRAEDGLKRSGKPFGTIPHAGFSWQDLFGRGYALMTASGDVRLLREGALAEIKEFRAKFA